MKIELIKHIAIIFLCLLANNTIAREVLISTEKIQDSNQAQYFLLSVGINEYKDTFWPPLKWPMQDAEKVLDKLGTETKFNVKKTALFNEQATLENIQQQLNNISRQVQVDDTVILYFSGHGTLERNTQGDLSRVLVTHNTRNDQLLDTGLTHAWLRSWLDNLKSKKKMIVFATCNSGVGKSKLPRAVTRLLASQKGPLIALEDVSEGALILAAAAKGEAAREDDTLQGDIYTHFLLQALDVYDRNRDGMVSALEAHDYAREQTWSFTKGKQRPTADIELIGNADIPLFGQKQYSALPVLEAYDETLAGFQIRVDNGVKGRLPLAFALAPGGSRVALFSPNNEKTIAQYRVKPGTAKRITLDQVVNRRPISVGMSMRRYSWQDEAWEKLTGSNSSRELLLNLGLHHNHLGVGLSYVRQMKDYENNVRPTLASDTTLKSTQLYVEYRQLKKKFHAGVKFQLGRDELEIDIQDKVSQQSLSYKNTSYAYALSLSAGYEVYPDMIMSLEAGYKRANWQFDTIGDLNGERYWLGLQYHYQFDWRVRKL